MSPFWACVFPSVKWSERYHSPRNVVRIKHNMCKAVGGAWRTIRCLLLCKNCSKTWWLKTAAICYLSRYWGLSWGDLCASWWWWAHSFGCIQLAVSLGRLDLLLQLGGCLVWQSRAPRSPGRRNQLTLRLKLAHLPFWCMLLVKASSQGQPRPTGRGDGLRLLVGGGMWHRDGVDCQGLSLEKGYQHVTVGQWQVGEVRFDHLD